MTEENENKLQVFNDIVNLYEEDDNYIQGEAIESFITLYLVDFFNDFWYYAFIKKLDQIDNGTKE